MKLTLILKRIELYGQIIIPVVYLILSGGNLVHSYLLLLACQVLSCILNEVLLNTMYKSVTRRTFEIMFAILGTIFAFVYSKDMVLIDKFSEYMSYKAIMVILIALFSPVMVIMYLMVSVEEIGMVLDEIESSKKVKRKKYNKEGQ